MRSRRLSDLARAAGVGDVVGEATVEITGEGGLRLADAWREGPQAHLGITVAGFPNLFMLYGPNTNLGHGTIIFMIECQIRYIRKCIQKMQRDHLKVLTVDPAAQARFNAELQQDLAKSVWVPVRRKASREVWTAPHQILGQLVTCWKRSHQHGPASTWREP